LLAVPFDVEAAVRHCCRAADAAREASGFEAAAAFLTRALERISAEGGRGELRCEVLYQIALDHFCVGEGEQGRRALEDGAQLASEIGATQWLARCVSRLVSWLEIGGYARDLNAFVDRALEQMDPADDLYAVLLARKAELNSQLGAAERRRLYVEAGRLAAETGIPEVMLEVAISRAVQRDPTQLEESRAAVAAYRALEAQYPRALLGFQSRLRSFTLAVTTYWSAVLEGDLAAAQLALAECAAAAEASRAPQLRSVVDLALTTRALSEGRLDDASIRIERMRESANLAGGLGGAWVYCTALLAEARNDLGTLARLGSSLDLSQVDRLALGRTTGAIACSAALAGRTGLRDVALLLLSRLPNAELERLPVAYGDIGSLCSLAETYVSLGDRARADALYAKLEPYASLNAVGVGYEYKGSVAHYLGLLALQCERPDVAVRHFEAAIALNEKLGMRSQVARGRELLERAVAAC
jgi:tetratricopeptide (TPR) repeat protein